VRSRGDSCAKAVMLNMIVIAATVAREVRRTYRLV
jgi:hypothetical protein